ncbi:MAG: AAA domain-containing protein [Thermomicrobium sp.]|nr:AAA domain-containing protein [Thermomicrobium sp.]
MADDTTLAVSDRTLAAWRRLQTTPGQPQWLDVPVLVEPAEEPIDRRRIVLRATSESGQPLGLCAVYTNEWYPGCTATNPFSHYFQVLWHVLEARRLRRIAEPLRLQVLKAVWGVFPSGRQRAVLLKFIVAPEYTVTGSLVEQLYNCPLQVFFVRFFGLPRDYRERTSRPSDVRGRAIHAGYRRALSTFLETGDARRAADAYRGGVWSEWTRSVQVLLALEETRDGEAPRDVRASFAAADTIVEGIVSSFASGGAEADLYFERLFYSATRGLSGRADRVEVPRQPTAPLRVAEVKTRSAFGERDPFTGSTFPGGLQALAYRELLQSIGFDAVDAVVELVENDRVTPLPLAQHPIVQRLRLDLSTRDERVVDLVAQARNVFYCVASGLFTGYDRYRLDQATRNRRLPDVVGQFDLLSESPPCKVCAAGARRVCPHDRDREGRTLDGLFRYAPSALFSYWVWFHRQLKAEEHAERERLFHLVHTPPAALEREGIALCDLRLARQDDRFVTLERRERRLDTRIREEDTVLVTPQWPDGVLARVPRPGELFSVEGRVVELGEHELVVELRDRVPLAPEGHDPLYRVDQLTGFDMRAWQLEGLADFFVSSMAAAPARGRTLDWRELPALAQTILGLRPPARPRTERSLAGWLAEGLNASQRQALAAVLALEPGELLLVQGPPGTGKTALIAAMVRALVARALLDPGQPPERRPVLVLTNTHRAANEVVLKVAQLAPEVLPFLVRVGNEREDMEAEVASRTLPARAGLAAQERRAVPPDDETAMAELLRTSRRASVVHEHAAVFVATLGSADAFELRGLTFETVIVDEAGQATEPACLQALRRLPFGYRGRLVLVGDENQLPPVVTALDPPPYWDDLRRIGIRPGDSLRTSAFERLHRLFPQACIRLTEQYRMNAPICALVSHVFYDDALRPADDRVADRRLANWLDEFGLAPPPGLLGQSPPVLFLDTSDDPLARDSGAVFAADDEGRANEREAELVAQLLAEFVRGLPGRVHARVVERIGVISPYRRQNTLLRQRLARAHPALRDVRVDTVDRFQGGEREIVVVSLVNSNEERAIGTLHAEWRRLNVALSRARSLLVVVGDRATFTAPERVPEEAEARERFRRIFARIDELAARGEARVVSTRALAFPGVTDGA